MNTTFTADAHDMWELCWDTYLLCRDRNRPADDRRTLLCIARRLNAMIPHRVYAIMYPDERMECRGMRAKVINREGLFTIVEPEDSRELLGALLMHEDGVEPEWFPVSHITLLTDLPKQVID